MVLKASSFFLLFLNCKCVFFKTYGLHDITVPLDKLKNSLLSAFGKETDIVIFFKKTKLKLAGV